MAIDELLKRIGYNYDIKGTDDIYKEPFSTIFALMGALFNIDAIDWQRNKISKLKNKYAELGLEIIDFFGYELGNTLITKPGYLSRKDVHDIIEIGEYASNYDINDVKAFYNEFPKLNRKLSEFRIIDITEKIDIATMPNIKEKVSKIYHLLPEHTPKSVISHIATLTDDEIDEVRTYGDLINIVYKKIPDYNLSTSPL